MARFYLQTELPLDASSLTRWSKCIGEAGVLKLLQATIDAARRAGVIGRANVERVIIDWTVMPRTIAQLTDRRLPEKSREHLAKFAAGNGLSLRQNDNRVAPGLVVQAGHCAHAKQDKRMRGALRTLRARVGRVQRNVERQLDTLPAAARDKARDLLHRTGRILARRTKDLGLALRVYAPEVEYLSKGKARTPYEFGVKASIDHAQATSGRRDAQHAGQPVQRPHAGIVDRGYRGLQLQGIRILISSQRRGMTKTTKAMIQRRSAIEHMKMDGRFSPNPLKGAIGDALRGVLCGAGHDLQLILAKLRLLDAQFGLSLQIKTIASASPSLSAGPVGSAAEGRFLRPPLVDHIGGTVPSMPTATKAALFGASGLVATKTCAPGSSLLASAGMMPTTGTFAGTRMVFSPLP